MEHDPICPLTRHPHWDYGVFCRCNLIARVRADERERAAERVAALPTKPPGMADESAGVAWNDAIFAAVAAARGGAA